MIAPTIIDAIPFEVELGQFLRSLHIEEGDSDAEKVRELLAAAQAAARPRAMFRESCVDSKADASVVIDGITLSSRVLRVNLGEAHRAFPFLATCGTELDAWSGTITDMFQRYWADKIKEHALGCAIKAVNDAITQRYSLGVTTTMTPGSLDDWPISQQSALFALLGRPREAIGVTLTDSFLMVPTKSVSGLRFPAEVTFESCQLCPREKCPGRRARYDKDLFAKKYRQL